MKNFDTKKSRSGRYQISVLKYFALLCLFVGLANVAAQAQFTELTKLSYAAGSSSANFGDAVAIDGDTIIVGAKGNDLSATQNSNEGSAFIYVRQTNGAWALQRALIGGTAGQGFGSCVGISGDTAIIGEQSVGSSLDAINVYVRSGGVWTLQQRIADTSGGYGDECAISGDTLIARYFTNTATRGLAHIYVRSGGVWTQQAELTAPVGQGGTFLNRDKVTIDGDTAAASVFDENSRWGVYIFKRSGTTWAFQQRIVSSDGRTSNEFGTSLSFSGDTLFVGAPKTVTRDGEAYVFVRSGSTWTEQQKLYASDPLPDAEFGTSVAVEGNTAVVLSVRNNSFNGRFSGTGYVFQRSGTVWTQTQRFIAADTHNDLFGWSADLSGSNIVVGALNDTLGITSTQGSAYVFTASPATCTYSLSPTRSNLFPASGGAGSFIVTTQAGCAWQATVQDRVTWTTTSSAGTGSGTVDFNVAANSGKPRRATITINGQQVYYVNQAAGQPTQQGDFDQTFGNAGLVLSKGYQSNVTRDVKVQPDGKIVAVGYSFGNGTIGSTSPRAAQVLRYNVDGSLDTTFDGDGIVTTLIDVNTGFEAVVIQPDGKIVAGGTVSSSSSVDIVVVRYNPNGSLDTTFGTGGSVRTDFVTNDQLSALELTPDGKIVAGGTNQNNVFAVARYNANGTLDTTFDGDGKVTLPNFFSGDSDMTVQADGKIVGIGSASGGTVFVRLNVNGSLDTTFDGDGRILYPSSTISQGNGVVVQPDGKILGLGSNGGILVVRLNANGSLDTTFGQPGFGEPGVAYTALQSTPYDIALQPNGKIIVNGYRQFPNRYGIDVVVHRFNANGTTDTTFGGGDGQITSDEDPTFQDANEILNGSAVAIAPDGKIVVAGDYGYRINQLDVMVLRFLGEGGAVTTARARFDFDGDGKADVSVFRPSSGAWYIQQSQNGFTGVSFGQSGDQITPADYDGDGKTDVAVFRNGVWYLNRSSLGFTGVSFGTSGDIPQPADYDGDGKDDIAVFRPSTGAWYILGSQVGFYGLSFGQNGDKPVAADYDGDGKADVAVFRSGTWFLQRSQLGFTGVAFGDAADKPVPADYDGDGKADVAVFRPSTGAWYLQRSSLGFTGVSFGQNGDLPTPGDYDGDGKTDIAVYRPSAGAWYLNRTTAGFTGVSFGASEDLPAPNAFVR